MMSDNEGLTVSAAGSDTATYSQGQPGGLSRSTSLDSEGEFRMITDGQGDNSTASTTSRRRPVPGKGHRKSRKGCFNCKTRRVKCSETLPECHGCRRIGKSCVYPASRTIPLPICTSSLLPKTNIDLSHLRFYHHFLSAAHPPVPHGTSAVWHDVARLSHQYEFLASAILALAAQHLTLFSEADYSVDALRFRVSAINGLNTALSQSCTTAADGDACYAAIIALTYQSGYMLDAMFDFLGMMRGWMIISHTVVKDPETSLFREFTRESFVKSMRNHVGSRLDEKRCISVEDYTMSLKILAPHCHSVAELKYLSALENLGQLAESSPLDAFLEMVPCYALTNKMTEKEYSSFTNPANHIAQVLLAHFLMLDYTLELHFFGSEDVSFAFCKRVTRAWVINTGARLPMELQRYMIWPLGVASQTIRI